MEWLGYCWHQPLTSGCSPTETFPLAVKRESLPEITHPFPVGSAHASFHTGAVEPRGAS